MIPEVRNLNEICDCSRKGLHKKWLLASRQDFSRMCDYMQKINYSIQDLNYEIHHLDDPSTKSIIYVIILVVWIKEAMEKIPKLFRKDVMNGFSYAREPEIEAADKYINAIRCFAVAHPLSTNRHPQFGFDGNYICVDIRTFQRDITSAFVKPKDISELTVSGLNQNGNRNCDFYFYVYSDKDDKMKYFRYIGCSFNDIYGIANLYVDKLYALNKYLKAQKKNDYR